MFSLVIFGLTTPILAVEIPGVEPATEKKEVGTFQGIIPAECTGDAKECGLGSFVNLAIVISKAILAFLGSIAFLMFIYGGITWLTAAGQSKRVEHGKSILTAAVIGIIITMGAYVLITFVLTSLGVPKKSTAPSTSGGQYQIEDGLKVTTPKATP